MVVVVLVYQDKRGNQTLEEETVSVVIVLIGP